MNNSDVEFPEIPSLMRRTDWCEAFRDFARETYKLNAKPGIEAIQVLLQKGYEFKDGVWLEPVKSSEPGKFDLEAAKRGEPIQTFTGKTATFLAHAPDIKGPYKVVAYVEDMEYATLHTENGVHSTHRSLDLFMQPKPKKTLYVNVYKERSQETTGLLTASWFTKEEAEQNAKKNLLPVLAAAHPIEIEVK